MMSAPAATTLHFFAEAGEIGGQDAGGDAVGGHDKAVRLAKTAILRRWRRLFSRAGALRSRMAAMTIHTFSTQLNDTGNAPRSRRGSGPRDPLSSLT